MHLQSDHRALVFVSAVALLGAGVRVARAVHARGDAGAPAAQPALDRQARLADSAATAGHLDKTARGRGQAPKHALRLTPDSAQQAARRDSIKRAHAGPLDRQGYIAGKLDLDVATAAQIDSLPGVTPLMARRIVADRMHRGPFLSRDGLRRVPGAGPEFVKLLDSLVVFSGTVVQPNAADTMIPRRIPRRAVARSKATPPPPS